jgi:hypothetical protein
MASNGLKKRKIISRHSEGHPSAAEIAESIVKAANGGYDQCKYTFEQDEWPWKVLGRSTSQTTQGLLNAGKAMKELALAVHPDKPGENKELRELATKFVNEAWRHIERKLALKRKDKEGDYMSDYGPSWEKLLRGVCQKAFNKTLVQCQEFVKRKSVLDKWCKLIELLMLAAAHEKRRTALKQHIKKQKTNQEKLQTEVLELRKALHSNSLEIRKYNQELEVATTQNRDLWSKLQNAVASILGARELRVNDMQDVERFLEKIEGEKAAYAAENKTLREDLKNRGQESQSLITEVREYKTRY